MKKAAFIFLFIGLLIGHTVGVTNAQQDPPHISCCFWIYSAGIEMGVLKSTARYSEIMDAGMIQLLFRIGEWVERANISCSELSQAWSGFLRMREQLDYYADWLARDPSPRVRQAIYDFTNRAPNDYYVGVSKVGVRGQSKAKQEEDIYRTNTCEQWYFMLGYYIGFAHHAFQVAAQAPESKEGQDARQLGLGHIKTAINVLYNLKATVPGTGWCVPLWRKELPILGPFQDMAQDLTRPDPKFVNTTLVAWTWQARREIAAILGDPSAGPAPPAPSRRFAC